jgi:hypothetical protein
MGKKNKKNNKSVTQKKRLEEINSRVEELILEYNKLFNYYEDSTRLMQVVNEIINIKDKIKYSPLAISKEDIENLEILKLEREELEKNERSRRERMGEIEKELQELGNKKRELLVDEETLKEIGEEQSTEKILGDNKNSRSKINFIHPIKSKSKKIKIYEFIDELIDSKEINFNVNYNETAYYVELVWQNYKEEKPSKESLRHYIINKKKMERILDIVLSLKNPTLNKFRERLKEKGVVVSKEYLDRRYQSKLNK